MSFCFSLLTRVFTASVFLNYPAPSSCFLHFVPCLTCTCAACFVRVLLHGVLFFYTICLCTCATYVVLLAFANLRSMSFCSPPLGKNPSLHRPHLTCQIFEFCRFACCLKTFLRPPPSSDLLFLRLLLFISLACFP